MKPLKIEKEGPFYDEKGYLHTDTSDPWHAYMPRVFWTAEARRLFKAALDAGILQPGEGDSYFTAADGITKGQLAYWCIKASEWLGLTRGIFHHLRPFDEAFGFLEKPLRNDLHAIGYYSQDKTDLRRDLTDPIDAFFADLDAEPAPASPTSTSPSTNNNNKL